MIFIRKIHLRIMGKYLKKFNNHTEYEEARQNLILPNVSLCVQENEVHYNPYVETRLICKYNVTSTSEPTALRTNYEQNIFKSMEIDGVMLDELVTAYTFDTTGVHTVKYELYDKTKLGGNNAPTFYNGNLIEAIIPDSVTNISINTFLSCESLTSITIPNSVASIDIAAFNNCSSLTSIDIPDSVTTIGGGAFQNCSSLTSVTIPDSVTSIGSGAFESTNALKVLNYNAKCELSSSFRSSWPNLETVVIGDSTPSIGDAAFNYCSGLTSVTIGSGVTSIGSGAFGGCTSLTSVTIPNSVTSIGGGAFQNCSSLTSINVNSGNTVYDSRNNCNAIIETSTNTLIVGCKTTIIPDSVTSIGNYAFQNCSSLTNITIPDSVTSIGFGAFNNCSSLISITIGNSVTSIGFGAFQNCRKLSNIVIPNSVTSISGEAFRDCSSLTSITIGSGVTTIGDNVFYECSSLTSIVSNAITAPTIKNYTFNKVKTGGTLTVPSGSSGYNVWMGIGNYYLGLYNWTKVEQ